MSVPLLIALIAVFVVAMALAMREGRPAAHRDHGRHRYRRPGLPHSRIRHLIAPRRYR